MKKALIVIGAVLSIISVVTAVASLRMSSICAREEEGQKDA